MSEQIHDLKSEEQGKGAEHSSGNWIPGLILVGLGVFFLLNNVFDIRLFQNWWALFILIPAVASLGKAWTKYRQAGGLTEGAIDALIGGLFIGSVALVFLFGISWSVFWPVMLIILGVGILLRRG